MTLDFGILLSSRLIEAGNPVPVPVPVPVAEAWANPFSQLAFTVSNGFTFVEAYLARGRHIENIKPTVSATFPHQISVLTPKYVRQSLLI